MPLINESTPEGFFHQRLLPYKNRMLEDDLTFFPLHPDPTAESYFDEPGTADPKDRIVIYSEGTTASSLVSTLRERWKRNGDSLLVEMSEPLEALRQNIVTQEPKAQPVVSDFVYPLF